MKLSVTRSFAVTLLLSLSTAEARTVTPQQHSPVASPRSMQNSQETVNLQYQPYSWTVPILLRSQRARSVSSAGLQQLDAYRRRGLVWF